MAEKIRLHFLIKPNRLYLPVIFYVSVIFIYLKITRHGTQTIDRNPASSLSRPMLINVL